MLVFAVDDDDDDDDDIRNMYMYNILNILT